MTTVENMRNQCEPESGGLLPEVSTTRCTSKTWMMPSLHKKHHKGKTASSGEKASRAIAALNCHCRPGIGLPPKLL
eukprot:CAMPEP_0183442576 /NCGR_PEP_ID=MMETSP0370-20130417/88705_1 /TAXON_ID=268820 /ORGANISM="Peridinium aciculiferum, Strain PAER-2" /LENGTH=75 /DNA_ID=CAMNT_0025632253 /DNA_START=30 /DNA_END=257 /DNA_ORIENTATION=+